SKPNKPLGDKKTLTNQRSNSTQGLKDLSLPVQKPTPSTSRPTPRNETIPITGWEPPNFDEMHKKKTVNTLMGSAPGFMDLVDDVYERLLADNYDKMQHFPQDIFRYYCATLWWARVIIPDKLYQYYHSIGNFTFMGETFHYRIDETDDFTGVNRKITGFLKDPFTGNANCDPNMFWKYADLPIPGILLLNMIHEFQGIKGWNIIPYQHKHSSWSSTYQQLGFTGTQQLLKHHFPQI
ncbi:1481_t:CDS:2, partial [Ambispora gerdemannii]